ncbi:MAG: HD domain-containing phosphohydrolase [Sulfurimonas sp.]
MTDIKALKILSAGFKVLYVEDEPELRNAVGTYLKKIFESVDVAENGKEGLKKFQEYHYDIVITDIEMPCMNGLEMAAEMKVLVPDQEIIIISAYTDSEYFMDAIRLGINGYIIKPVNYEQINMTLYKSVQNLTQIQENMMYKAHLEEMVEERTQELMALEKEKIKNFEKTLFALVEMIEARDSYTAGHSQRVAGYSRMIAQKMGRSDVECELLYRAGILHDIGKIVTPDSILLKPGKLNGMEYKLIQEHVKVGYNLLSRIPMYKEMAEVIVYHHEHYNGMGYPHGAKGEEIPFLSRIMIVADAFDAMTTNRIYKGKKDVAQAVEEIKMFSGKQFDPEVVETAVEVLSTLEIPDSVNQLPMTEIEKERFAYFYRDQVTNAYNADYLTFTLNQKRIGKKSCFLHMVSLHNLGLYNKNHG